MIMQIQKDGRKLESPQSDGEIASQIAVETALPCCPECELFSLQRMQLCCIILNLH
jgi:hypothetical protein